MEFQEMRSGSMVKKMNSSQVSFLADFRSVWCSVLLIIYLRNSAIHQRNSARINQKI